MTHKQQDRALILMYHRVAELEGETDLHTLKAVPSRFEAHIRYLQRHYRIVSLPALLEQIVGGRLHSGGQVAITFDDGYADNYANAYPVLKKHGAAATIFLPTDYVDGAAGIFWWERLELLLRNASIEELELKLSPAPPRLYQLSPEKCLLETFYALDETLIDMNPRDRDEFLDMLERKLGVESEGVHMALTWTQIREMSSQGVLFGSHTCSHASLHSLDVEELRDELKRSKREIELRIGRKVDTFAYPYGHPRSFNEMSKATLLKLGYTCACSTVPGFVDENSDVYALNRLMVRNWEEAEFAGKVRDTFMDQLGS